MARLSSRLSEPVSAAYLSRLENGRAAATLGKLSMLGQLYDTPLARIVERFGIEEQLALSCASVKTQPGRPQTTGMRLMEIDCLIRLGHHETAKLEAERVLAEEHVSAADRLGVWQAFVTCCLKLGRPLVGLAGLGQAESEMATLDPASRVKAEFLLLCGDLQMEMRHAEKAIRPYARALRTHEQLLQSREACRARILLAGAMIGSGRFKAGDRHLTRALKTARRLGYRRLEALALSNLALAALHTANYTRAETWAIRSNEVARQSDDQAVCFRNTWYLLQIAEKRGDRGSVRIYSRTLGRYVDRLKESMPEVREFLIRARPAK